jgi:hypothetical protein
MINVRYVGEVPEFVFVLTGSAIGLVAGRTSVDSNEFSFCEKVIV